MLPQISCDWVINYDVTCTAPCCAPADCLPGTELLTQGSLLLPSWAAPTELLTQSSLLSLPCLRQPNLTQDQGWIPSSIISQSLNASIQWWDCSSLPFPGHQSKNRMQNIIIQRRQVEPTLSIVLQKLVRLNEADDISFPILSHICTLYSMLYSFWYICFVLIYNPWSYMYKKHMPLPFTMKGNL